MDALQVPQTAVEKLYQKWDPTKYELVSQFYPCTLAPGAAAAGVTQQIQVPELIYVFALLSSAVVTATGALATVKYRIGFKSSRGEDWTNGQWMAALVTGDVPSGQQPRPMIWQTPRILAQNEILICTVDNNLPGAVALTIDAAVWGLVVRERRAS